MNTNVSNNVIVDIMHITFINLNEIYGTGEPINPQFGTDVHGHVPVPLPR